ncbi:Protein of unknown function [Selenomonas sp. GACV-9]|uniref:DUF721 domain-containing protein n=1 Tax=Selenomonas sp. GACV-9 TaxID=3158782 RepID=UPI0008E8C732|nr:Protein of unknown function [Selenomonas ruminantium]
MAKRNLKLEKVKDIIPHWVKGRGGAFAKKFYAHWVLWHWADIVGEFNAKYAEPQGIRKDILHLYCGNATLRNELMMMQEQITQMVNNYAGQRMITGIVFGRRWEHPDTAEIDEIRIAHAAPEENWGRERRKVVLSAEEAEAAEQLGPAVQDQEIACKARQLYKKHLQMEKLREAKKWHPCTDCGTLCPPEKKWCPVCAMKRREQLLASIRQVLRDIPWARCKEVQEYVPLCTPKLLNEQRAIMVQQLASEVDVNDKTSIKAMNLVMLCRCLPPEHLTEEEIARTLYGLRFNLHRPKDYKAPKRYSVIPLGKKGKRQS